MIGTSHFAGPVSQIRAMMRSPNRPTVSNMYKIATWNLDRPTKNRISRRGARLATIAEQNADLWILTETDRNLEIDGFRSVATQPLGIEGYGDEEALAAIHFDNTLEAIPLRTFRDSFAVCARFPSSPLGPLIVYASIITYHMDGVWAGVAKAWQLHQESTRRHGEDWRVLRRDYPDHMLVVAGDFNQALDGVGKYRNAESMRLLEAGLIGADLICMTREDFVASGKLESRHSVDHIAVSRTALTTWSPQVTAWEGTTSDGTKLSDHNGVAVALSPKHD